MVFLPFVGFQFLVVFLHFVVVDFVLVDYHIVFLNGIVDMFCKIFFVGSTRVHQYTSSSNKVSIFVSFSRLIYFANQCRILG